MGLPVLLTLVLAACSPASPGAVPPPTALSPSHAVSFSGTVDNWSPVSAGRLQLETPVGRGPVRVLSSATVGRGGQFRMELPSADQVGPLLDGPGSLVPGPFPADCAATFAGGAGLQVYSVFSLHALDGDTDRGRAFAWRTSSNPVVSPTVTLATVKQSGTLYLYASTAAQLSGDVRCSGMPSGVPTGYSATLSAPLAQGWNVLSSELTTTSAYPAGASAPTSSTVTYRLSPEAQPSGLSGPSTWNLYGETATSGT